MTETRFYEPARLSTPPKPLISLNRWTLQPWLRSLLSKVFQTLVILNCDMTPAGLKPLILLCIFYVIQGIQGTLKDNIYGSAYNNIVIVNRPFHGLAEGQTQLK